MDVALSIVLNAKTEEEISILNTISLNELVSTFKEAYKIVHVLKSIRNKRISEIDYTSQIEDLIRTYKLTHELTEYISTLKVTKSKYNKGGTRWYFQFTKEYNDTFGTIRARHYNVDISHIPLNINFGSRIEMIFKDDIINEDPFFKQFKVKKNFYDMYIITIQFEDPLKIIEVLSYLSIKYNL